MLNLWWACLILLVLLIVVQIVGFVTKRVNKENVAGATVIIKAMWYLTGLFAVPAIGTMGNWADWLAKTQGNLAFIVPISVIITSIIIVLAYLVGAFRYYMTITSDSTKRWEQVRIAVIVAIVAVVAIGYFGSVAIK